MKKFLLLFIFSNLLSISQPLAGERLHKGTEWISTDKIVLQGLDKISARVFTAEVYLNQKVHFGSLEIYVRSADRSPPGRST